MIFHQIRDMRSLFFLIFYSSIIFPRGGQHQFYAVFLIDAGSGRVVVDGDDIFVPIKIFQGPHRAFSRNVIGQTTERLCADDIIRSRLRQRRHFGGNQPAFPHLYALIDNLIGTAAEMLEVMRRLKRAVLDKNFNNLLLDMISVFINERVNKARFFRPSVKFRIIDIIYDTIQYEIHERGHDGFRTPPKAEIPPNENFRAENI